MAAQRKHQPWLASPDLPRLGPASRGPRLAGDQDVGGVNPALSAQRELLERLLAADEPPVERYAGATRLAIILGGSGALWALAAAGAWRLIAAL